MLEKVEESADDENPQRIGDGSNPVESRLVDLGIRSAYMYYKKHFMDAVRYHDVIQLKVRCVESYFVDVVDYHVQCNYVCVSKRGMGD